jgi:hypothetical protein
MKQSADTHNSLNHLAQKSTSFCLKGLVIVSPLTFLFYLYLLGTTRQALWLILLSHWFLVVLVSPPYYFSRRKRVDYDRKWKRFFSRYNDFLSIAFPIIAYFVVLLCIPALILINFWAANL